MLRALGDGIWCLDHPLRLPGGFEIGTRTVVVRLPDDGLLLHSPGPLDETERAAIDALGTVRAVVAPNAFHHLFLEQASVHYPEATLHAVPSVQARYPGLATRCLTGDPDPAWKGVLEQTTIDGAPRLDEVVFFHPASRTLLLVDLCFHTHRAESWRTKVFLQLAGAWQRFGPCRLAKALMRDESAVRASVDRVLGWDFDRLTVTHGDVVETGARERLRDAFAWLAP